MNISGHIKDHLALGLPYNSSGKQNTIAIIGNSIAGYHKPGDRSTTVWAPGVAKSLTNVVKPTYTFSSDGSFSNRSYICTTAGTTASTYAAEPVWPTTNGETVVDGTNGCEWTCQLQVATPGHLLASYWSVAQALSGQRLREVQIDGLSGQTASTISTRLSHALAFDPGYVLMANWLENDAWPGSNPTLANIEAAWLVYYAALETVRLSGRTAILSTLFPSGNIDASSLFTGYSTANGTKAFYYFNHKIREYARKWADQVIFFDAAKIYIDTNTANPVWPENATTYLSASGAGQALKKTDGIHHYNAASWLIGSQLSTVLTSSVPAYDHFSTGAGDYLNGEPNPSLYGTAGTNGASSSGSIADSYTVTAYGTVPASVGSKVARTDGISGSWQRLAYTATTGDNVTLDWSANKTLATLGWAVGDIVEAVSEIRINANPTLLTFISNHLRFVGSSDMTYSHTFSIGSTDQDFGQFITADTTLTIKNAPVKVPTGTTSVNNYKRAYGRGACNLTVDWGRSVVRKVTTPAIA